MTNASEGEEPRVNEMEFSWTDYYAKCDEKMLKSKEALKENCAILFKAGITRVKIKYEGSGDNGCIEQVSFFKDKHLLSGKELDSLDLPTFTREEYNYNGKEGESRYKTVECSIEARIEDCAYAFLPGGFEINEGSFGDLIINTEKAKATLKHNERFESSEYSEVRYDLTTKEVPARPPCTSDTV